MQLKFKKKCTEDGPSTGSSLKISVFIRINS